MFRFQKGYFTATVVLFLTEVCIALFLNDALIRPYVGDVLVVILVYCFVKSFWDLPVMPLSLAVLIFAFVMETLQYFEIARHLGLPHSHWGKTIIGTSFEWMDMAAYLVGILITVAVEKTRKGKTATAPGKKG
jgi:uncharacterized membrane protein